MHVKHAISRAGLGSQLDALEHEMDAEQRQGVKTEASGRLLKRLEEALTRYRNDSTTLAEDAAGIREKANAFRVETTFEEPDKDSWIAAVESERARLESEIALKLGNDLDTFKAEVEAAFGREIILAEREFNEEARDLADARKRRVLVL
jgi:predicted  nucleic acid-binding Zn-ribbon protein